jgi:hypothetical protein
MSENPLTANHHLRHTCSFSSFHNGLPTSFMFRKHPIGDVDGDVDHFGVDEI